MRYNLSLKYIITPKIIIFVILSNPAIVLATDYNAIAKSLQSPGIEDFTQKNVDNIPGYQGTNVKEANYYKNPASLEDESVNKAKNDEAGQVARNIFSNQGDYQFNFKNDPLFASEQKSFDSHARADWLKGGYSDCDDESKNKQDITINNDKSCDQYLKAKNNQCIIKRIIEVESNYKYSCTKNLTYSTKTCSKSLNVTVTKKNGQLTASNFGNARTVNGWYGGGMAKGYPSGFQLFYHNSPYNVGDKVHITPSSGSADNIYTIVSKNFYSIPAFYLSITWTTFTFSPKFNRNYNTQNFIFKTQLSNPDPIITINSTWGAETCS